ncbi:olfactory receptor 4K14-like, partial [Huso huso]
QRKEMNVQQNASSQNRFPDILWAQSVLLILVTVFFFSLNFVMVFIYFKEPVYQGVPRYMLFIHLLINDFLQAAFSVFLFLNACLQGTMLLSACSVIVLLSACTSMNTPLNLAVMSLERYVAICFPLHHVQLCTVNRGYIALALIWLMGILPSISDISIAYTYGPPGYFQGYFNCKRSLFMILPSQSTKQAALNAVYFSSIWAVVIYTYIKIMLTAKKAASDKSSASKGQRTVLLHGVQLILSMSFFIYPLTEYFLVGQPLEVMRHVLFFNYYVTLVLPKCLTPLIYGVRDENFKRHLKQYLCLCAKKVQPLRSN